MLCRIAWRLPLALALLINLPSTKAADIRAELEKSVDAAVARAELLARARRLREQGEALAVKQDRGAAATKFREAQDVLLSSGESDFYDPTIHTAYLELAGTLSGISSPAAPLTHLPEQGKEIVQEFSRRLSVGRFTAEAFRRLRANEGVFRAAFRSAGVPEELIYIGLIESGYDSNAVSPAGAVGIWQFMPATAKRYGLRYFAGIDERLDATKSAAAAAKYLRDLNQLFGDWLLALAGYNAGEYRILRIIRETGSHDFWELRRLGVLPKETADYVPSVLAAANLAGRTGARNLTTTNKG